MPISDAEYEFWKQDTRAIRVILVEATRYNGTAEVVEYLSDVPFIDTETGRVYDASIVSDTVQTIERISLTNNSFISVADVGVANHDGSKSSWLEQPSVWNNRSIKAYHGDLNWGASDFRMIFNGVIDHLDSSSSELLDFVARDKLQRLDTPMTNTKLGGSTDNADELIPLCFGEVHNVTPLLVDPATLEYQVHDGPIEDIIEVRDNGVPLTGGKVTKLLSTGKFRLNQQAFGRVTCSVQGHKVGSVWPKTAGELIRIIVTEYGDAANRFSTADLDEVQIAQYISDNPAPVGVYVSTRDTVLTIARKLGAQLHMNRAGLLRLLKVTLPAVGTPVEITENDILANTMRMAEVVPVTSAFKLGYAENYTVQDNLLTGLPEEHKELFKREWLTVKAEDAVVSALYRSDTEPELQETALLTNTDATAEANRLLNIFKVPRFVPAFDATARFVGTELTQAATVTYPDYNLNTGKTGMVLGLATRWGDMEVGMEVLV